MTTERRRPYPSDLTDDQHNLIEPLHAPAKTGGRPRTVDLREILNAIFYLNRTGCQWRALPHDFPRWSLVAYYYYKWIRDGSWERFLRVLREGTRIALDKEPTPSMVIIDSQTVKATEAGGDRGYDGNKKINGKKRHILVDTLGLLVAVMVTSADQLDGAAAPQLMSQITAEEFPRLQKGLGDQAYEKCGFPEWVAQHGFYEFEFPKKAPEAVGFKVIKWRWLVERTIAWINRYRRNSKDYERLNESGEAMIKISSIQRILRFLKPSKNERAFTYRKTS